MNLPELVLEVLYLTATILIFLCVLLCLPPQPWEMTKGHSTQDYLGVTQKHYPK